MSAPGQRRFANGFPIRPYHDTFQVTTPEVQAQQAQFRELHERLKDPEFRRDFIATIEAEIAARARESGRYSEPDTQGSAVDGEGFSAFE